MIRARDAHVAIAEQLGGSGFRHDHGVIVTLRLRGVTVTFTDDSFFAVLTDPVTGVTPAASGVSDRL